MRTVKTNICNLIKRVAVFKANANCIGFMYEPKKPEKLVQEDVLRKENQYVW